MRTAAYARFSSDLQRATSLEDQLRNCREYADRHGWAWQDDQVYTDAGISGASIDGRPGLQALLTAAAQQPRSFDILLVDDSSRVARDLADALRIVQRLKFAGVRVLYLSQGIDSASEQAETLIAVHGLVDGLYLREMAAKIKRGLKGQLTRGLATGGVTYGYRTIPIPDPNRVGEKIGCRIEIVEEEAVVVRRVFEWFADSQPVTWILEQLHASGAPAPRGGGGRGVWRVGAVRRILANPKYRGLQVWGRTKTERKPGSRAVVARTQPATEWQTLERPDLRIIDEVLWQRVQELRQQRTATLAPHRQPGRTLLKGSPALVARRASLFTGFLTCGVCGKAISVSSRHVVKGRLYRYFGCQFRSKNGAHACSNGVTAPVELAERALLAGLQAELTRPETVAYVTNELAKALQASLDDRPARREDAARQRDAIRGRIQNLLQAIESGSTSSALLTALSAREAEAARLDAELATLNQPADESRLRVLPTWVRQQLDDVAGLLYESPERARAEFERLQLRFTFHPVYDVPAGQKPYIRAVGEGCFEHLTGSFPTTGRSLLPAVGSRKFVVDLPSSGGNGADSSRQAEIA